MYLKLNRLLPQYLLTIILLVFISVIQSCTSGSNGSNDSAYILPDKIDFNFHVRPILSDRCFNCHGPDISSRKAELRLDNKEDAYAALKSGNGHAIVPNRPSRSNILDRLNSDDDEYRMPPPSSNLSLSDYEIALIEKWIDQGAEWKKHWSFIPPQQKEVPVQEIQSWIEMNEIDHFIAKKAINSGLSLSQEADKERLLRRLYLDLTGLPPSVEEIDAFLADNSTEAYSEKVEELLLTDAHAERLTMEWLDVSRYADSHGLHADGWRNMYPWRDWVINAFKENISFKSFIEKQLAGDMIPNASNEDILATAFNRNHPMTAEGGAIDEEWRLNYVFDRTETMGTALLGMTVGCAKCHDHKYDPISQKEYYQLASFFNNVRELGMTGDDGNYGPILQLINAKQQKQISTIQDQIATEEKELQSQEIDIEGVKSYIQRIERDEDISGLVAEINFDSSRKKTDKDQNILRYFDGNKKYKTFGPGKLGPGKSGQALIFEEDYNQLYLEDEGLYEMTDPFSFSIWINTIQLDSTKTQTIAGNSGEKNNFWRGWEFYLDTKNHLNVKFINSLPHNCFHIMSQIQIDTSEWSHVGFSYDGSGSAEGINIYHDGTRVDSRILYNKLTKSIKPIRIAAHTAEKRSLALGKSRRGYTGESGIFYGMMDQIRIFDEELTEAEMAKLAGAEVKIDKYSIASIAHRLYHGDELRKLQTLRLKQMEIYESLEEIMVMEEKPEKNSMYVYHRGEYDKPMEEVLPGTPASILNFPSEYPTDRIGLTQWIFDPNNPLTARVVVNRYWQMIFGRGLVSTPGDFGFQGALPSHPDLLDWLAVDFIESEWDIRHLIRKMVTSATYRQSSFNPQEERMKDPQNIYLARGPSYRLQAEMIRDNALTASGLLNASIGGESVKPYQPEGLWIEKGSFSRILLTYKESQGDSLYRRSMYTFVKRSSPHPVMTTFDAPNREVCTLTRENTNTPLQALVLMNDPQFIEAAKVLAQRVMLEGGRNIHEQLEYAFRACTGRKPIAKELSLFVELYESQLEKFNNSQQSADDLLSVGEYVIDNKLDTKKMAALTVVTNTILNHDDTYTKR